MANKLVKGFLEFRKELYAGKNPLMPALVENGQDPEYFIISCIDSRSNPGTIFRPAPGTFFAHKAMGAIVRPYKQGTALAAALQFALHHNNVTKIILLGHTGCGAINALINNIEDEEIASFVEVARAGLNKAHECTGDPTLHDDLHRHAEEQILLQSMENLKTYPSVAQALKDNQAVIKPWLFEMESGNLFEYDETAKEFVNITQKTEQENA